jgi:hypothetical protein
MNSSELKTKQEIAIRLLALGEPKNIVAAKVGVSKMTLSRWHKNPVFNSQLASITNSGLEATAKMLNAAGLTAAETLQEILCDLTQPATVRLKASLGLLSILPSINASLQRYVYQPVDFDINQRWGSYGTYNSQGELIDKGCPHNITEHTNAAIRV